MTAKLELAISLLSSQINQECRDIEGLLASHLKNVGEFADPIVRAEWLLKGLRNYASPVAQAPLVRRLAALATLKEMLQLVESNPAQDLSFEFNVGRHGDDYAGGGNVSVPIDESKLSGSTMELVCVLRLAGVEIEWPERSNSFKARFIIKAR